MIFAIDPGPERSAWVMYGDDLAIVDECGIDDNRFILSIMHDRVGLHDMPIVVEMVASYGMPVGSEVFETCVWVGRFLEAAEAFGCTASRLFRSDIKMHLCHTLKGVNDAVIRQALIDRFGPGKEKAIGTKKTPGPLYNIKSDMWAALAVAVTFADTHKGGHGNGKLRA